MACGASCGHQRRRTDLIYRHGMVAAGRHFRRRDLADRFCDMDCPALTAQLNGHLQRQRTLTCAGGRAGAGGVLSVFPEDSGQRSAAVLVRWHEHHETKSAPGNPDPRSKQGWLHVDSDGFGFQPPADFGLQEIV